MLNIRNEAKYGAAYGSKDMLTSQLTSIRAE
jgi:hypothetical protein